MKKRPNSRGKQAPAVAQKIGVAETAAEFFKRRAGEASGDGLMQFLRKAPKAATESNDVVK